VQRKETAEKNLTAENAKNAERETRIINREIRGIHERGEGTGDSLKGVSREIFTEMIDSEIVHCEGAKRMNAWRSATIGEPVRVFSVFNGYSLLYVFCVFCVLCG
jgi:hypothetical protein